MIVEAMKWSFCGLQSVRWGPTPSASRFGTRSARPALGLTALLVLAALLRVPGLETELWLDEIRALGNVASIDSASGVFTAIHHDSNHWLVSLWMYALGPDAPFWSYRLPSFLAGVAAVLVAGCLAAVDEAKPETAMLLGATSFPLIFYSSEARGYSLAALAGLLLLFCLVRWLETGETRWLAGGAVAGVAGVLSHLSFLLVLIAATIYALVVAGRGGTTVVRALAMPFAALLVLAMLIAIDLRYLGIGGGTRESPSAVLAETASLAVGGPIEGRYVAIFALTSAVVLLAEIARRMARFWPARTAIDARSHLWTFYAALALLPVWAAYALDPPFLFPRYFLVCIAFVPLLAASLVKSLRPPWSLVLVAFWVATNGYALARFTAEGRGQYQEALQFLLASSPGKEVVIASDHDLRNERLVGFYAARLGEEGLRLKYVGEDRAATAAFWIASYEGSRPRAGKLLRTFPSSSLSGATWAIYRSPGTR
jgi:uncharacterized membrane protein